jgi:methylglutaconyl-CoA hydratase
MSESVILVERDPRGIATVTLNRPQVNNAYDRNVLQAASDGLKELAQDVALRALVLRGNGRHFQAGVDLKFQNELAAMSKEENDGVSLLLTELMRDLNAFPIPTIALIQGACIGGGTGFAASCDVVIASEDAIFAVAEVKWGAHASPIFPQLIAAMGVRHLRRYAATAESFDARRAWEIGLVHEICPKGGLDEAAALVINSILLNGPAAVRRSKELALEMAGLALDDVTVAQLAREHAATRQSAEAREGFQSFVEKRLPFWHLGEG